MRVGDLVRTKETYLPKPRPLGLIVGSKIWDLKPHRGKLTFLVQFFDDDKPTWWTEEHLEVICE